MWFGNRRCPARAADAAGVLSRCRASPLSFPVFVWNIVNADESHQRKVARCSCFVRSIRRVIGKTFYVGPSHIPLWHVCHTASTVQDLELLPAVEKNIDAITKPYRCVWSWDACVHPEYGFLPVYLPERKTSFYLPTHVHDGADHNGTVRARAIPRTLCRRGPHLFRHWLEYFLLGVAVVGVGQYVHKKQTSGELDAMVEKMKTSVRFFFHEHFTIPAKAIYEEVRTCLRFGETDAFVHALGQAPTLKLLFASCTTYRCLGMSVLSMQLFHSNYLPIGDPEEIAESRRVLRQMLKAFAADYYTSDPVARKVHPLERCLGLGLAACGATRVCLSPGICYVQRLEH